MFSLKKFKKNINLDKNNSLGCKDLKASCSTSIGGFTILPFSGEVSSIFESLRLDNVQAPLFVTNIMDYLNQMFNHPNFCSILIFISLLGIITIFMVSVSWNNYRTGIRVSSLSLFNPQPDDDALFKKLYKQACIVNSGTKYNLYSRRWLEYDCVLTSAEKERIYFAARAAYEAGDRAMSGYKVVDSLHKVCRDKPGNKAINSSGALLGIMWRYDLGRSFSI